jgi:hypothetical protein
VFVTEPKPSLKKRDSSFSWFSLLPLFLLPQVDTVFYLKKKLIRRSLNMLLQQPLKQASKLVFVVQLFIKFLH